MAPSVQRPSQGPVRFVVSLLGASQLRMPSRRWRMVSPTHMGIMRSRYEGSFSATRHAGSFA